jgi:aspartate kinase
VPVKGNGLHTHHIIFPYPGFFGNVPGSLLSTIGRGYTDLCAALTAVGLGAEELQIWKEVDGIFTADPRKVANARLLPIITPEEAAELTYYGSEVIHPFTMEQVIRVNIPIRIKNVENPAGSGTVIFPDRTGQQADGTATPPTSVLAQNGYHSNLPRKSPTAVTIKDNICVLNVHSNRKNVSHGFLAKIFTTLDDHGIVVDLISTSEVHVSMALNADMVSSSLDTAVTELKKLGSVGQRE